MRKGNNNNNNNNTPRQQNSHYDCTTFRRWLFSLTRNELLTAMTVDFSSGNCHEYDLLVEMVKLEAPPPTPIHPRGYGFRPISSGQLGLPVSHDEKQRLLQMQPRMFQFSERSQAYSSQFNNHHRSTRGGGKGSGRSTLQQQQQQQQQQQHVAHKKYDIIARKKITPWGQILSTGCTSGQRDADSKIVQGTYIRKNPNNNSVLIFHDEDNGNRSSCQSLIRMLNVASRGYFLTAPGSGNSSSFCSPWLQPTERWFTLSFYLASRYHVSLWNLFLRQQKTHVPLPIYEMKILKAAIPAAVQKGFSMVLQDDLRMGNNNLKHLRDTLLWHTIVDDSIQENTTTLDMTDDWNRIWDALIHIPLRQISNIEYMKVKSHILDALRHTLASEMEKAITEENDGGLSTDTTTRSSAQKQQPRAQSSSLSTTAKSSKPKRKKKRRKRGRVSFEPQHQSLPQQVKEEQDHEGSSEVDNEREEGKMDDATVGVSVEAPQQQSYQYIDNDVPPNERNRNIVFVLGILNGVLENVFETVGLGSDNSPSFDSDAVLIVGDKTRSSSGGNNNKNAVCTVPGPKGLLHRNGGANKLQRLETASKPVATAAKSTTKNEQQHMPDIKDGQKQPIGRSSSSGNNNARKNQWVKEQQESSDYSMFPSMPTNHHQQDQQQEGIFNPPTPPFNVDWSIGASFTENDNVFQPSRYFTSDDASSNNGLPTDYYRSDDSISNGLPTDFHKPLSVADTFPFVTGGNSTENTNLSPLDGWSFLSRYQTRDQSILTDFFQTQEERIDEDEKLMAASTAASISSSTYKDAVVTVDDDDDDDEMGKETENQQGGEEEGPPVPPVAIVREIGTEALTDEIVAIHAGGGHEGNGHENQEGVLNRSMDKLGSNSLLEEPANKFDSDEGASGGDLRSNEGTVDTAPSYTTPDNCRSPSPQAPETPPPTLSPILLSLDDLKKLKNTSLSRETSVPKLSKSKSEKLKRSSPRPGPSGSLPNSPVLPHKNGLTPSWSREDLRIASFQDDSGIKARRPPLRHNISPVQQHQQQQQTYRAAAIKSLARPIASSKGANFNFRTQMSESPPLRGRESCTRSETALDERHGEEHQWQPDTSTVRKQQQSTTSPQQDDGDNKSTIKNDETTTITSALSNREQEDNASVRDERNSFRDMCLTLGAEVSKLKAMLAAQRAASVVAPVDFQDGFHNHSVYNPGPFDPNGMPPFFGGMHRGQFSIAAMSDAGVRHSGGDYESQVSEDEVYSEVFSKNPRIDAVRRMSSSATVPGSDASIENNGSTGKGITLGAMPVYDSVAVHGLQSRLTKDILLFLNATSMQLRKQDSRRRVTVERFSRLVNTIWPRAQVKLYGSHVSGLCLPSSDLDFVICLPAVHKNAPALAPGVLEGRNAINESSQKLLARELKGESWVDPRSIKLIERTVVPVIKVSTKDTRARMLQLDISFDSPEHHGLHANQMVAQILEELPLIRPLMLVMKQFLLDRGLLTAYTGGLSSYCLFLMIARYLQEQSPTCVDCGSLLMGFLDFHGNHFDPRATGVSVYRRQYFARQNYEVASYQAPEPQQPPMWFPAQTQRHSGVPNSPLQQGPQDFRRRNSFSDTGSVDGKRRSQTPPTSHQRPPRFQPSTPRFNPAGATRAVEHGDMENGRSMDHGRPFTFDPLFVEDPLSAGNNVGRNAFRIFQVQRAFSDAHRALVASLEWDIHSSGDLNDADYPLLKCLLHSEDVLYEL